jgi:hypothetical protein
MHLWYTSAISRHVRLGQGGTCSSAGQVGLKGMASAVAAVHQPQQLVEVEQNPISGQAEAQRLHCSCHIACRIWRYMPMMGNRLAQLAICCCCTPHQHASSTALKVQQWQRQQ